jgi:ketosteroid isomerase-like protein
MTDPHLALAERLIDAITSGNVEAVREIYAPEATIWHNHDGVAQTVEENLAVLRWVVGRVRDLRYEEIRRHVTADGFVQQHVLRGTAPSGHALAIAACLIGTVRDGRIVRLEEYLDPTQFAPLLVSTATKR